LYSTIYQFPAMEFASTEDLMDLPDLQTGIGYHANGNTVILSDEDDDDDNQNIVDDGNMFHLSSFDYLDDGININDEENNANDDNSTIDFKVDAYSNETLIPIDDNSASGEEKMENSSASLNESVKEEAFELPRISFKVEQGDETLAIVGPGNASDKTSDGGSNNNSNNINNKTNGEDDDSLIEAKVKLDCVDDEIPPINGLINISNNNNGNSVRTSNESQFVYTQFESNFLNCDNNNTEILGDIKEVECVRDDSSQYFVIDETISSVSDGKDNNIDSSSESNVGCVHISEKIQWNCDICAVSEKTSKSLAKHLRIIHGVRYGVRKPDARPGSPAMIDMMMNGLGGNHLEEHLGGMAGVHVGGMSGSDTMAAHGPKTKTKKCRSVYGLSQKNLWCTQCQWKKACARHKPKLICHQCHQCDYQTDKKSHLVRHLKTHGIKMRHVCDQCNYQTDRKSNFNKHLKTHGIKMRHVCDQCDYQTDKKGYLVQHLEAHKNFYPCKMCDFKGLSRLALLRHEMIHMQGRNYACTL